MDRSIQDLQSSLDSLIAEHGEMQELFTGEIDRAATLHSVVVQVRAMVERWVVDGCNADTSKDLAQMVLAAIVSQAPETAALLSETESLQGFIPEHYAKLLSANRSSALTLEDAQSAALLEILQLKDMPLVSGGVQ